MLNWFWPANKWRRVFVTVLSFFSLQIVIQLIEGITGIVIIRALTKANYSIYTLASSLISSLTILSEMGAGSAILSLGGGIVNDKAELGGLLGAYNKVRSVLSIVSMLVIMPIALYMFLLNHYSYDVIISCLLIMLFSFTLNLRIQGSHAILVLKQQAHTLQKIDIGTGLLRLFAIVVLSFLFLNYFILLLIALLVSIATYILYKRRSEAFFFYRKYNPVYYKKILSLVKKQTVYYLYYIFQGQISFFLISLFGQTLMIAELGAINRINLFNTIIAAFLNNMANPKIACISDKRNLFSFLLKTFLFLSAYIILFLAGVYFFSEVFLWVVGDQYRNVRGTLFLMAVSGSLTIYSSFLWGVNYSRGWINNSWLIIAVTLLLQSIFLFWFKLSDLNSFIVFSVVSILASIITNLFFLIYGIKKHSW